MCLVVPTDAPLHTLDLVAHARLGSNVKKTLLLASVVDDVPGGGGQEQPTIAYLSMFWEQQESVAGAQPIVGVF